MPRGTDYRPEYDQMLIDHMAKGFSFESFAAIVKSDKRTLYEWVKANASFHQAKNDATDQCRLFWEQKSIDNMNGQVNLSDEMKDLVRETGVYPNQPTFNASNWIFNMKNRFKDEWRDKQELEHSGPNGGPVQIETTPAQFKDMLKDAEGLAALETIIKKIGTK